MKTVAIMQPTYLPWLGYFALMAEVDVFVFLDSVQFDRRSWQQRNRVKGPDGIQFLTVPVKAKGALERPISEIEIDPASDFRKKHVATLRHYYARSRAFDEGAATIVPVVEAKHKMLADYTIAATVSLAGTLGLACAFMRSSELGVDGVKAELLARICERLQADRYVSPVGSAGYLSESDAFAKRGIEVVFNAYTPVSYSQLHGNFVPSLSVADALLAAGIEATRTAICDGRGLAKAQDVYAQLAAQTC